MKPCPACGPKVKHDGMCYACPHNGKVRGRYEDSPCRACDDPDEFSRAVDQHDADDKPAPTPSPSAEEIASTARAWCLAFNGLSPTLREFAFFCINNAGTTLSEAARSFGLSKDAGKKRAERIRRQAPIVWEAMPQRVGRRRAGPFRHKKV